MSSFVFAKKAGVIMMLALSLFAFLPLSAQDNTAAQGKWAVRCQKEKNNVITYSSSFDDGLPFTKVGGSERTYLQMAAFSTFPDGEDEPFMLVIITGMESSGLGKLTNSRHEDTPEARDYFFPVIVSLSDGCSYSLDDVYTMNVLDKVFYGCGESNTAVGLTFGLGISFGRHDNPIESGGSVVAYAKFAKLLLEYNITGITINGITLKNTENLQTRELFRDVAAEMKKNGHWHVDENLPVKTPATAKDKPSIDIKTNPSVRDLLLSPMGLGESVWEKGQSATLDAIRQNTSWSIKEWSTGFGLGFQSTGGHPYDTRFSGCRIRSCNISYSDKSFFYWLEGDRSSVTNAANEFLNLLSRQERAVVRDGSASGGTNIMDKDIYTLSVHYSLTVSSENEKYTILLVVRQGGKQWKYDVL